MTKLISSQKKNKDLMTQLIEKQEEDFLLRRLIQDAAEQLKKEGRKLTSAQVVQSHIKTVNRKDVELKVVKDVLKKDLDMTFGKARDQAININSTRNVLLRQAWALRFLKPDLNKKVILNVDESWIAQTDYRRMMWRVKGESASLPKKTMTPRISFTLAIDTEGHVYYSLSQANNNSETTSVFLKELAGLLDKSRKGWRKNTVVLIDNAPYHTSKETKKTLAQLKIPTMYLAPYSFDVAPCELYFALFKSKELNPENLATGKR